MFRSSRRWTVPSWRMLGQPRQTLPLLVPPPPCAQPRTRGAPLAECRPRLPRRAISAGPRRALGAGARRAGDPSATATEPADSSAALRGGGSAGAAHPASLRASPPGALPSSPSPHPARRGEAASPARRRGPSGARSPRRWRRGHSLKKRGGGLAENPAGKPPASRRSAERRSGCPRAGMLPGAGAARERCFLVLERPRGLRGDVRGCAGMRGSPAPPAGRDAPREAAPPRASRTGASVTNPVGSVLIQLSRNSLGLTSVISQRGNVPLLFRAAWNKTDKKWIAYRLDALVLSGWGSCFVREKTRNLHKGVGFCPAWLWRGNSFWGG